MATSASGMVTAIDDLICKLITAKDGVVEYTIANRHLKRYTLDELKCLRDYYSNIARAESGESCIRQKRAIHRSRRNGCW